jgi:uroporphyrinogen decarboxylase
MKFMEQIIDMRPDYLHSIDPMAGMDIKIIKKMRYHKIVPMGNVQCNFLQDGSDEEIIESAKYCLDNAAEGGGYIFSTSNTVFKGLPLRNDEVMLDYYWKRYGVK